MLSPIPIPGLIVTGTDTGVGKTVIAGAIARWLARDGRRVAVFKPVATGCQRRWEGLVSEDAEFLASCADARHPLHTICPVRYAEPLAPAVAAARAGERVDWEVIDRAAQLMARESDVMVVEGVGGALVPMDEKHTFADVARWLQLPAIVVARPGLGTINHTLLTLEALRSRGIPVAGVVINRYPTDTPPLAEETNPRVIEKWGKVPVLCICPDELLPSMPTPNPIPPGIEAAVAQVDWMRVIEKTRQ
jgi:dethiobiotin synthetase